MADVKPVFLNSNGVWEPVGNNTALLGDIKLSQQTTPNGVLSTDGSGAVSSSLLTNDNVSSSAAIAGSKIDPNFGSQNIYGNGANVTDLNASNLSSGTVPDARFPATLPAVSGANLTSLNASNLSSGTVPDARFPATLPAVSGANLTSLNASNLSSGTVPDAAFPATLPAVSGANLTSLNASNLSSGTVADARLSSNVALYDAAAPIFANKLGVGTPLSTDTGSAATVGYVTNAINTAITGLDYKSNAKWYALIPAAFSITDIQDAMNAEPAIYAAGDRFVINAGDPSTGSVTPDLRTGIYVVGGTSGAWTLTRSTDFASGSDEAGAYVFCANDVDVGAGTYTALNQAYVVQQQEPNAVVGTNALSFTVYGAGATYTAGDFISISLNAIAVRNGQYLVNDGSGNLTVDIGDGLTNIDSKIAVQTAFPIVVDGSNNVSLNFDVDTLELNVANNLAVIGVPEGFKIGPDATDTAVTAQALNTLVGGIVSNVGDATELHWHSWLQLEMANTGSTLTAGSAVFYDGSTVSAASKTDGKVIGLVAYDDASGAAFVAPSGMVAIQTSVLVGSPAIGDSLYVGSSGALCTYASLSPGDYVTKVGRYLGDVNGTGYRVAVAIQEFGIKP